MSAGSALLDARAILEALGVAPGDYVADLASGRTGHFAFSAAEAVGQEGRVYAVDILRDVVAALESHSALRQLHNVIPVWGDVERHEGVNIPAQSLDVALLTHMLGSAAAHEAVAREAQRLMKPGGRVVVIDWQPDARHPLAILTKKRRSAETADVLFAHLGCRKCGEFLPSAWHWGRVYTA